MEQRDIPVGEITEGRIVKRFGSSYAVIEVVIDGEAVDLPVRLSGFKPLGSYEHLWRNYIDQIIPDDGLIYFVSAGHRFQQELDVIELIAEGDKPLGVFGTEMGWGAPTEAALQIGHYRQAYHDALFEARLSRSGIWNDSSEGPVAFKALSSGVEQSTRPPSRIGDIPFMELAPFVVVLFIIIIGLRMNIEEKAKTKNPLKLYWRWCAPFMPRTRIQKKDTAPGPDESESDSEDKKEKE